MSTQNTLLRATGIAKSYGPVVALRSANLTVKPGETHALLGANGAGKSTFVKILTGVIGATSGSIEMADVPTHFSSPAEARAGGVSSVYQDPALLPDLTVTENLRLTGTPLRRVQEELTSMGLGELNLKELVRDVPLPFLRMIDLARALAHDPTILVLDEITAALPTDLADRVFQVMRRQAAAGKAVLFISHRLDEVVAECNMCTVFRDGRDVETFVPREGGEQRIVQAMLGEAASLVKEAEQRIIPDFSGLAPRLELAGVGLTGALSDIDLVVRPGEVVGVVALEGQGQETLFEGLAGVHRFDQGQVLVGGKPLVARHPARAIKSGLALVPADRSEALLPQRSIRDNLSLPLFRSPAKWGPINAKTTQAKVNDAIRRMSIDTRAADQARRLSGGNQQKLTIGRWLTAGFSTLLLFDPTRGIDIGTKHQIYGLIRDLADDGASILMYTSELREIPLVADRALVLYQGRIVASLSPHSSEEELLSAAHGIHAAPTDQEVQS